MVDFFDKVRSLGLVINKSFNWNDQLLHISRAVYGGLHRLLKFAYLTPKVCCLRFGRALLIPYFLYCDVILGSLGASCRHRMLVIFNSCIRHVKNLVRFDHVSLYSGIFFGCPPERYLEYRTLCFLY